MVHALREICRALEPQGHLLDLRPVANQSLVEVVGSGVCQPAGRVRDLLAQIDDDTAAAEALARARQEGWLVHEHTETFDFHYYFDTPEEMKAYIDQEWAGYTELPNETFHEAQRLWSALEPVRQARVRLTMVLGRWRKG